MERITLNIIPKGITPVCHASQFDIGRVIRCDIMDDLQGYVFSDETVELRVRKPDDNVVTASVDVVSGDTFVLIETTEQMTACDGVNKCELRIMKGDVRIGSLNFDMKVEVDPLKDGIESETEIHNLETQIHDMNEEMLPDMVAEEVTRQYDSENVIFDDVPTENHGDGYTVNSAGLKSYIPKIIDNLDDVDIDNPTSNQALVYNPETNKWENGEVSTVGGLNDLNDVTLEDVADKQELVYDDTDDVFKNKTTRVELTQAQYNALANPLPDVDYYITDAPSMQGTSADLSYDGTTKSVYTKIGEMDTTISGKADTSSLSTVATSGSYTDLSNKPDLDTNYVRVGKGHAPLNLDECVNGYVYWCNNTGSGGYINAPGASAYHIYTFKPISTHGFQMAVQHNGNAIYVRTVADNVWGAWKSITLS